MTTTNIDKTSHTYADKLEVEARGRECLRCETQPRVAWIDGYHQLRCGCYPVEPMLIKEPGYRARRLGKLIAENTPESALLVTDTQLSVQAQGPGVVAMPPATTIEEYDREQALVQHIMGQMQEDKDYGLIPGTRKKTLYEPGAEALRRAFRIVWKYRCLDKVEDFERMEFYYHIEAYQLLAPGVEGIAWEASAWSREKKFNGMEREMLHHNVRDRAIKRAFVALIRNIAAASGEFDPGGAIKATDDDALICSDHGVPFLYHAEGRYGPFYSHTGPKHNVGERKIAEFTQAPTRGPENGREQGGEVEADPQEVTVE